MHQIWPECSPRHCSFAGAGFQHLFLMTLVHPGSGAFCSSQRPKKEEVAQSGEKLNSTGWRHTAAALHCTALGHVTGNCSELNKKIFYVGIGCISPLWILKYCIKKGVFYLVCLPPWGVEVSKKTNVSYIHCHGIVGGLESCQSGVFCFCPGKITSPEELTTPAFLAQMAVSLHSLGPKQIVNWQRRQDVSRGGEIEHANLVAAPPQMPKRVLNSFANAKLREELTHLPLLRLPGLHLLVFY